MAGEQGGKEGQRPKDEGDAWGTKGGRERVKGVREKYEHPWTWLCKKLSTVFSDPKSSAESDHRMSHIRPRVGGSRKRSI
jgi:hypothetical protein